MEEERKPLENRNFIDAFIEEDLAPGGRFEGKTVHISGHLDGQYFIEEDNKSYAWTDQMFQARYEYDTACVCESLL